MEDYYCQKPNWFHNRYLDRILFSKQYSSRYSVFVLANIDVLHMAINGENVTKRFIERYLPLLFDIVVVDR